jgi:hypothetical protein
MYRIYLFLCVTCLLSFTSFGQNPGFRMNLIQNESFNTSERKIIRQTLDGGYAIFNTASNPQAIHFMKMDSLGNVQFRKTYTPTGGTAIFGDVVVEPNGTYTVLGTYKKNWDNDLWFFKLSATGEILLSKFYSYSSVSDSDEQATQLKKLPDNQYILFGKRAGTTLLAFKVDSLGIRQWSKGYNYGFSTPSSVELLEGFLYLTGLANEPARLEVCKMDLNGNIIWVKQEYHVLYHYYGNGLKMVKTTDNKLLIGNLTDLVIKMDTSGQVLWTKEFTGTGFDYNSRSLIPTADGGFLTCSNQLGLPVGFESEGIVSKFDANSDLTWVKRIGTVKNDEFYEAVLHANGRGYTLFGRTWYFETWVGILLVKIDLSGNLPNMTCENALEIELTTPTSRTLVMQPISSSYFLMGVTVASTPIQVIDIQRGASFSPCGNVQLTSLLLPNITQTCEPLVPVKVKITNKDIYPVNYLALSTWVNGFVTNSSAFENLTLLPNADTILTLPNAPLTNGLVNNVKVEIYNVNGFDDYKPNDNRLSTEVRYQVPVPKIVGTAALKCQGDSVEVSIATQVAGAQSYQWLRNGLSMQGATNDRIFVKDMAAYRVRATNLYNCVGESNTYSTHFVAPPIRPVIARSGTILTASGSNGASYQWYLDNAKINNAVQAQYTTTANGNYTVESVIETCRTLSQPYNYVLSGASEVERQAWKVTPNPCSTQLQLSFETPLQGQLTVYDLAQNRVWQQYFEMPTHHCVIPMAHFGNGVYWVRFETTDKLRFQQKVVKLE